MLLAIIRSEKKHSSPPAKGWPLFSKLGIMEMKSIEPSGQTRYVRVRMRAPRGRNQPIMEYGQHMGCTRSGAWGHSFMLLLSEHAAGSTQWKGTLHILLVYREHVIFRQYNL